MEQEIFTDRMSGTAFLAEAGDVNIYELSNGIAVYETSSTEYPEGYVSKAAFEKIGDFLQANPEKDLRDAFVFLSFANVHADDGNTYATLMPAAERKLAFSTKK